MRTAYAKMPISLITRMCVVRLHVIYLQQQQQNCPGKKCEKEILMKFITWSRIQLRNFIAITHSLNYTY